MKKISKLGNRLLLLDYNNIIHKSIWVNKRLTYKGKFTGGVYGFIKQMISAAEEYSVDHIIACKDSPPYIRKDIYSDYKGDRPSHDETFLMKLVQSKSFVDEFLNAAGIQIEDHKGFEADDLVAQACMSYTFRFNNIYIKSNDDDLFQLLRFKNVILLRNKGEEYCYEDFKNQYDLNPLKWVDVHALKGSHNNVKGIKGVGIVTALKVVKDKDLWDKYYADYEDMIELNRKLMKLPYDKITIPIKKLPYDKELIKKFLSQTGIRISLTEIENLLMRL